MTSPRSCSATTPSSSAWPRSPAPAAASAAAARATFANGSVAKSIGPACSASTIDGAVGQQDPEVAAVRGVAGQRHDARLAGRRGRCVADSARSARARSSPKVPDCRLSITNYRTDRSVTDRARRLIVDRSPARAHDGAAAKTPRPSADAHPVGDDAFVSTASAPISTSSHSIERVTCAVASTRGLRPQRG